MLNNQKNFFKAIGFKINPKHENAEDVASFLIGENNFVLMLFPNNIFKNFHKTKLQTQQKTLKF